MSAETLEWLNKFVLIGNTAQRGDAWHRRKGSDNHWDGPVPVEEVEKRLFNWEPVKVTPEYPWKQADGSIIRRTADDDCFIIRSDNGDKLGSHADGFSIHGYREWLLKNAEMIMGTGLEIGQAGLLKNGAQAWVSFEFPDTIEHKPKGARGPAVAFRPQFMATTSLDGSIASTFKLVYTIVVCDNTRTMALGEKGDTYRVKHTRHSRLNVVDARDALNVTFKMTDAFKAELDTLLTTSVNSRQWDAFKELYVPRPEEKGRGQTMSDNKRDALNELYETDPMCAPWNGTAYGVIQTVNTYQHHRAIVRKTGRVERNAENAITGKIADLDMGTWETLNKVLQTV